MTTKLDKVAMSTSSTGYIFIAIYTKNGRETILSAKNSRKGYWIFESFPQCHFSQKSIAKDCNTIQLINAVSALPTIEYKDEGMVYFYISVVAVHSHRNYLSCSHINIPHYYYFRRYVIDFVPAFLKLAMNRRELGHLEFVSSFEAALSRSNIGHGFKVLLM